MIFVVLFFALGVDTITIQYAYSDLDAKSVTISYLIAEHGNLEDSFIKNIEESYNVKFQCISNCSPLFGDSVEYIISTDIKPIIVSKETMEISLKRTAIIGFYN